MDHTDSPGEPETTEASGLLDRDVSRRSVLIGGFGVAATLLYPSVSRAASSIRATAGETTAGGATAAAARRPFPVTVHGRAGSATVRSRPKRVVAAGYLRDTDLALALGAPLVAAARNASFSSGLAPWQHPKHKLTLFSTSAGMPFEEIADLRPDLILASDDYTLATDFSRLSEIAPTLSYKNGPGDDSWELMTTRAGEILGQSAEAATLVAQTHRTVAATRRNHPVLSGKTFTFGPVLSLDSIYTINSAADPSAKFFSQLGMKLSPRVTKLPSSSTPRRAEVSLEQIGLLNADVVILAFTSTSLQHEFESQPLFKKLPAVRRGSYIPMNFETAVGLAFPSVLSIPYGLKVTVPKLVTAARQA